MSTVYKYEFSKFLDSPDIRNYNKNREFAPAEQSVLIVMGQRQSVEEKLMALKYLLNAYTEEEFGVEKLIGIDTQEHYGVAFKEVVQHKINVWEMVLESRYDNTEVVYAAFFDEEGFVRNNIGSTHFFSNYNGAYSYLLKEKESYMEGESEDTQVYGRILRIPIDSVDACCDYDELLFDSGMRLTVIHEKQSYYVDVDKSMPDLSEDFRCYVGIPWKPGALVKISSSYFEKGYGILRTDPEKERVLGWIDGTVSLDVYDEVNGRWTYRNGISILSLESCTEQEVLEQKSMLESWKLMKGNQRSARAEDFPSVENTEQVIREWLNDHREYLNTLNVSDRDRKIITAFLDGERYSELARKFSLSPSRVRSLVVRFKMKVYWSEREKKRSGGEL